MDTTRFDAVTRLFDRTSNRRETLRRLAAGAAVLATGGALLVEEEAAARKRRKRRRKENPCKAKNWCVDRSQTCGPEDGYGKCLVKPDGKHICAEILFQVPSCTECEAPNCIDCQCVVAEGGDDRCNNGANGYGFICVRKV